MIGGALPCGQIAELEGYESEFTGEAPGGRPATPIPLDPRATAGEDLCRKHRDAEALQRVQHGHTGAGASQRRERRASERPGMV